MRLIICLSLVLLGCNTAPTIKDSERCIVSFDKIETNPQGEEVVSGHCRCGQYRFDRNGIGWVDSSKNYNKPISHCNKLVGWTPDEYKSLYLDWENFRVWLLQQEK